MEFSEPIGEGPRQWGLVEINDALDRLGTEEPRLVTLIEMRFIAGMSAEEVAEACGDSIHTVRRNLRDARARLRAMLSHGD